MITLLPNQIHLWVTEPASIQEASRLAEYDELLSPDEKNRQQRFHFEKDRKVYLCTRALVRTVLSEYAPVAPHQWEFERNAFDKPEILHSQEGIPPLRFNLTHSDKLIACAVTLENNIGVDVENRERNPDLLDIANRYFSPKEARELNQVPVGERGWKFFEYWTLKEAYIKACGKGLHIPLDAFSMDLSKPGNVSISFSGEREDDPQRWQFQLYQLCGGHYLSLAVETSLPLSPECVLIREGFSKREISSGDCILTRSSATRVNEL